MNYIQIVDLVFLIVTLVMTLFTAHFLVFALVGLFAKKRFPKTEKKLKYGILIAARNEEKVIEHLIKSIQANDYPQDQLQIFVVAHNCTDNTAAVAREHGATVYEYNNLAERTKGYAIKHLVEKIEADFGTQNYDGFFVFDADNVLSKDFLSKMNDAFAYYQGNRVITSCRNSKNFGTNIVSGAYGLYFLLGCRLGSRGRSVLGCSARLQGTGYVLSSKVVKNGWNHLALTEDLEFSADEVLHGRNIVHCDDAVVYDEQPTSGKIMLRQRLRWTKGRLLIFFAKTKALLKKIFTRTPKGEINNKFSAYDIITNLMPFCVISSCIFVLNWIFIFLTPLFMSNYLEIWKTHAVQWGLTILVGYFMLVVLAILIFICEHKRIKGVSFMTKVCTILFWPIFIAISLPLELISVFKKVDWKTVPHTDTTNFEKVNSESMDAAIKTDDHKTGSN